MGEATRFMILSSRAQRGICFSVLLLATACRGRKANVGDGPYADKVAADVPQIEEAVGLKFKTPPKLEIRTRDQVREFLLARVVEPEYKKQIANQEALFKTLGL